MGFGDVILLATIGSFLGWQAAVVVFFLAPVCALAVVAVSLLFWRRREIPYGPYLSLAALWVLLGWKSVWPVADRIFSLGPAIPVLACLMAVLLVAALVMVQGVKRLLGIPLYEPDWIEEWTSADQLHHYDGENTDRQQGQWRTNQWPGTVSGRGTIHYERWRRHTGSQTPRTHSPRSTP
jgi:leader peptidase (prepilin peptidase)/N-methyltransferase